MKMKFWNVGEFPNVITRTDFQKKTSEDFYGPWMQWGFSFLLDTPGHADNSFIM